MEYTYKNFAALSFSEEDYEKGTYPKLLYSIRWYLDDPVVFHEQEWEYIGKVYRVTFHVNTHASEEVYSGAVVHMGDFDKL